MSVSVFQAPSGWDEGAFMLAARELLLGNLPYQTFWDNRPLGSTVLIAAAMAAFGQSVEAVRILGLVCVTATGWALHAIAWRVSADRFVALASALLYVAFSTRLAGLGLMNEILLAPFTALGVLLLLLAPERRDGLGSFLAFAAAGLAFGVAVWIKFVPAIPAALVGGFVLVTVLRRSDKGLVRAAAGAAAFAVGLLLPALSGAFVYWWTGNLDVFLLANFGFAGGYMEAAEHRQGAIVARLRWIGVSVVQIWPLMALTAAAFLPTSLRYFRGEARWWGYAAVGLWLVGEFLALVLQTKFYEHHFLVTLLPMSVAAAAAVRFHVGSLAAPPKADRAFALAILFVALVAVVHHLRDTAAAVVRPDVPREIAQTLKREMAPGDSVYVANYTPVIYLFTGTTLPTRFAFPQFLMGNRAPGGVDVASERRRVLDSRPKYILIHDDWRHFPLVWSAEAMTLVEDALAQRYSQVAAWPLPDRGAVRLFSLRD